MPVYTATLALDWNLIEIKLFEMVTVKTSESRAHEPPLVPPGSTAVSSSLAPSGPKVWNCSKSRRKKQMSEKRKVVLRCDGKAVNSGVKGKGF